MAMAAETVAAYEALLEVGPEFIHTLVSLPTSELQVLYRLWQNLSGMSLDDVKEAVEIAKVHRIMEEPVLSGPFGPGAGTAGSGVSGPSGVRQNIVNNKLRYKAQQFAHSRRFGK